MQLFNTLTGKKEEFTPIEKKLVGVYSCGPTVYETVHIGNLRAFLTADILVRTLRFFLARRSLGGGGDFRVKWVMNITDIDDKTIAGAQKAGKSLKDFTSEYEQKFYQDLEKLNIQKADAYPKATEHFSQMRELVDRLLEKGVAYEANDGIYFSIEKFPEYGKLSGLEKRELKPGARVDVDSYDKQSPGDFALWKLDSGNQLEENRKQYGSRKTENRSPVSDIPTVFQFPLTDFPGRPGWSIECSAMSRKYLGQPFDIHTGGIDLVFPHHENEIAQSVAAYGKPLANFFIHNEHLLVDGKKMAKSEGNYITLDAIIEKGFDPLALRYLFLQTHYREKMNFTWEALEGAQNALRGIRELIQREMGSGNREAREKSKHNSQFAIQNALEDDLNTPKALGLLHEAGESELWLKFDELLGLGLSVKQPTLTDDQQKLVVEREQLRKQGKFEKADRIRKELAKQGIVLEDTPEGTRVLNS